MSSTPEKRTPDRGRAGGKAGLVEKPVSNMQNIADQTADFKPTDKMTWALRLAAEGFRIFPLPPGEKAPDVKWQDVATTDPEQIKKWFADDPDINYGVCPDERHAVVDLDVGGDKDGIEAFGILELEHGPLDSFTVRTWSGGRHVYVQTPYPVGNGNTFPDGIDVRGHGGYVVGPGSEIGGKPYEAQSEEIAIVPAPPWVLNRMRRRGERDEKRRREALFELDLPAAVSLARDFLATRAPAVEGHGGDEHTYVTACRVKDFGISEDKAFELMMEPGGWNDRCKPPWDGADLKVKVANAYSYGSERPGAKGGSLMELVGDDEVQDVADRFRENVSNDDEPERWGSSAFKSPEQATASIRQATYVISEWLPDRGLVACLAKRGEGKTTALMDMALSIASDLDWHDQPTGRNYWAVYFAGEDSEGALSHMRAWMKLHQPESPRFLFVDRAPDLLSKDDCQACARGLKTMLPDDARAVLVIDTWQRASSRGKQNDDSEMQTAVHNAEAIAKAVGGPIVAAFHPPKDGRIVLLGSSVLENSTTAIWNLTSESGGKQLEVSRIKGRGLGNRRIMRFEEIGLEERDSFGRELTGLVPLPIGGTELKELEDEQTSAMADMIRKAMDEHMVEDGTPVEWSVNRMAQTLAGQRIEIGGRADKLPGKSKLNAMLPDRFRFPFVFEDGAELSLITSGNSRIFGLGK